MIKRLAALPQFKVFVSTVGCSLAFVYFLFGLDLNIPVSIVLVGLLYFGFHLLMKTYDPQVLLYKKIIKEVDRKLGGVRQSALRITDAKMRMQVMEIISITEQVLKFIQKNHASLSLVRKMLTFYLDNTSEILGKYASLQGQKFMDASTIAILQKMEEHITSMRINFESQLNKLLQNDLSEMTVKMDVIKEMLLMEDGR